MQPAAPATFLQSNRKFLRFFLLRHGGVVLTATLCSILLGFVSAVIASLVGPSLKLLAHPNSTESFSFIELFGPRIGAFLAHLTPYSHLESDTLLRSLPFLLAGIALIRALLSSGIWYMWEQIGESIATELRMRVTQAFLSLNPAARSQLAEEEEKLSAVVTTHIKLMKEFLTHFYGGFPRELLQILFLGTTLVLLSPQLFLLAVCGVLPAMVLLRRLGKKISRRAQAALQNYALLTEWLQQRLSGIETIKHLKTESLETQKFAGFTTELNGYFQKANRTKARTSPLLEVSAIMAMALVLAVALREIQAGELTGPSVLSFFTTLAMIGQSASIMGRYFNSNREGTAAVSQIRGLLVQLLTHGKEKIEIPTAPLPASIALSCQHLYVRYPGSQRDVLVDFSFEFERGKIYSLVGPSGVGKSTLFKVLLGQLTPHAGRVCLSDSLAGKAPSAIGYLPQNLELFTGTVEENIAYPAAVDAKRVHSVCRTIEIESFIQTLPDGYASIIGPRGTGLSGGQIQRILLARLFYHLYPVVLIDEGTSALDPQSERIMYRAIEALCAQGATILMISHRSSVDTLAHQQIVFSK